MDFALSVEKDIHVFELYNFLHLCLEVSNLFLKVKYKKSMINYNYLFVNGKSNKYNKL